MRIGRYRVSVDLGHLLLLAFIAGWVIWYAIDARRASPFIENTVLIVPASMLALLLCAVVALQTVTVRLADGRGTAGTESGHDFRALALPAGLMGLLGVYAVSLERIGFDLSTLLFVAGGMLVIGERRWKVVIPFAVIFSLAVVYGLKAILPLRMPTVFF